MRRTRPCPRGPLVLLLALVAASCGDGGGGGEPVAAPHELRLTIVRGKGMRVPVRPVDAPQGQPVPSDEPIVVEVSALIGANRIAVGSTGPSLEARLPPVELRWRAVQPWCEPLHATTTLSHGDTVHNYYRRPTVATFCQMVVEGVSNGWVFDADTALVKFDPGPPVSAIIHNAGWMLVGEEFSFSWLVAATFDAYDNLLENPPVKLTLASGPFRMGDTSLVALAEGKGKGHVTVGPFSRDVDLWAFPDIQRNPWRLTWACHDVPRPGGVRADSIRFVIDSAGASRGGGTPDGWYASFTGRAIVREWRPGEPVKVTDLAGYSVMAILQPGHAEWSPGERAARTSTGWAGGSLCPQTLDDPAGGFGPVKVEAR